MEKLSLVIPIYNEAQHLQKFLELIDKIQFRLPKELVFLDDKSTDASLQILQAFPFTSEHQIIALPKNSGKGAALQEGIMRAKGNIIGIQDADFEYDPNDIHSIIELFLTGKVDVVYGSRFKKNGSQVHRTFHYLGNRVLTIMSNFFSGLYLTDMESCFKFFKAEIIQNVYLQSNRFGFEPEVTAKIARLKIRMCEVPISYYPRNYLEGKKITWKDGIAALRHIIFFNLFSPKKRFFKESLPNHFIPKDSNFL